MTKTNQTETTAKILTSYRRMILRAYNAKPTEMTDAIYCKRHKIKLHELRAWQKLAGQQLAVELQEMRTSERIVVIAVPGIFSTKCHIFRESGVIICIWVRG